MKKLRIFVLFENYVCYFSLEKLRLWVEVLLSHFYLSLPKYVFHFVFEGQKQDKWGAQKRARRGLTQSTATVHIF